MPELPEVETVKTGLAKILQARPKIKKVDFLRKDLRYPLPVHKKSQLIAQQILNLQRRAKYILFETEDFFIISHLGMTGSWRLGRALKNNHDHIAIEFDNNKSIVYRDPRRFGIFDFIKKENLPKDKRFSHLGPEPFDLEDDYLFQLSRKRKVPVKNFIMDQKVVVGVGNIYASEALFLAGISPIVQASRVSQDRYKRLAKEIKNVLKRAIKSGGTTINDYIQTEGEMGYFQNSLNVYDRKGEPCTNCGESIKLRVLAGRSTYWCKKCQK